jgi:ABC-type lipoprotein release transport system permease subunit
VGRFLLVIRIAARDLRRRPGEAALLLFAILTATTTLTLGLILHGTTSHPYASTRAATAGPDVVAQADPPPVGDGAADLAGLARLADARGVTRHSGPFPLRSTVVVAHGDRAMLQVEGRDPTASGVDQPKVTDGTWVRDGGVVVERSFADAFDLHVGDLITLNGRAFRVVGLAVTAAMEPYPELSEIGLQRPGTPRVHPGLTWATRNDARRLASPGQKPSYVINLKLKDAASAQVFTDDHLAPDVAGPRELDNPPIFLQSWQELRLANDNVVRNEQRVLLTGSWLLGLLALASIVVLVGGRMANQMRRVGLLKAVGGTPGLVAAVLLAQYLVPALLAAAAGLAIGRLVAPVLSRPSEGLIGGAGALPFTAATVAIVTAVALGVTVIATLVPAVRASRISTIRALTDTARPPRRTAWLVALSRRLPAPLLMGLRITARRPRRALLCALSVAITVSGIVAVLAANVQLDDSKGAGVSGLADPRSDRLQQVLVLITVMLVAQAAVNAIFVTWATVLDARHSTALAGALGATPQQIGAGLATAQIIPALAGALAGIPGGITLFAAVSPDATAHLPLWVMLATVVGAVLVMAALTAIPVAINSRRPIAGILQSEAG